MGYGLLIAHLLRLKGMKLSIGNEVRRNTYLFETKPKENKGQESPSMVVQSISVSSSTLLTILIDKAKMKRATPKNTSHLQLRDESEGSTSNEPLEKRKREEEIENSMPTLIMLDESHGEVAEELTMRAITKVCGDFPVIVVAPAEIAILNVNENIIDVVHDIQGREKGEIVSLIP